jgi:subtilase family serine protease
VFNKTFGLPPPPSFRKVNQSGGTKYPSVNAGWALETALDVQWAHALAPDAAILLVEASSSSLSNLLTAVSYAAKQAGVTVISNSYGTSEFSKQSAQDYRCKLTTAVCVFASGDGGNPGTYPATNPHVLAVGGTTLHLDAAGTLQSETAWSGSGGGISLYSAKPRTRSA